MLFTETARTPWMKSRRPRWRRPHWSCGPDRARLPEEPDGRRLAWRGNWPRRPRGGFAWASGARSRRTSSGGTASSSIRPGLGCRDYVPGGAGLLRAFAGEGPLSHDGPYYRLVAPPAAWAPRRHEFGPVPIDISAVGPWMCRWQARWLTASTSTRSTPRVPPRSAAPRGRRRRERRSARPKDVELTIPVFASRDEWVVGLAGQVLFHRRPAPKGETLTQKQPRDRESAVWGQLIEQVGPPPATSRWVHVMDHGADGFEVDCRARRVGTDWIGRVKSRNRLVRDEAGHEGPLSDVLAAAPAAGGYTLALRARPRQPARRARLEVAFAPVTTLIPRHPAASLKALAPGRSPGGWSGREVNPPPSVKEPINWVLLTSLPVRDLEGAMEVIGSYEKRWLIEEWHKALKTGCQVERRQLHTSPRLEALTGVLSVVAVRLLQMKEVGRREPHRAERDLVPAHYVELVIVPAAAAAAPRTRRSGTSSAAWPGWAASWAARATVSPGGSPSGGAGTPCTGCSRASVAREPPGW